VQTCCWLGRRFGLEDCGLDRWRSARVDDLAATDLNFHTAIRLQTRPHCSARHFGICAISGLDNRSRFTFADGGDLADVQTFALKLFFYRFCTALGQLLVVIYATGTVGVSSSNDRVVLHASECIGEAIQLFATFGREDCLAEIE